MIKENEDLYKDCLKFWGLNDQLRQMQEECAELICAVNHYIRAEKRGLEDPERLDKAEDNLMEEAADVLLMLEQVMTFFGENAIKNRAMVKASRVRKKLAKYKEKKFEAN